MAFDWFKRKAKNITTSTEDKKDVPKGLWHQTPSGKIVEHEELKRNNYVSPEDGFHVRIGSNEFFDMLFDNQKFTELDAGVEDRKSTRLNSSHVKISYAVFCLKKKINRTDPHTHCS